MTLARQSAVPARQFLLGFEGKVGGMFLLEQTKSQTPYRGEVIGSRAESYATIPLYPDRGKVLEESSQSRKYGSQAM